MRTIQWYPGHMAKAKREIAARLKHIDVVIELLDARAPFSSKNPDFDALSKNKKRLVLLVKADLAPDDDMHAALRHYEAKNTKALAINAKSRTTIKKIIHASRLLMEDVFAKEAARGRRPRAIRAVVVGIPNVGKSTLINTMAGRRSAPVGNVPGITRSMQNIRVRDDFELQDTPGILWPRFEAREIALKLALLGTIKDHLLPLHDVAAFGIRHLAATAPGAFIDRYGVEADADDIAATLEGIGRRFGALQRGGEIDVDRVVDLFIHDFRDARFGKVMLDEVPDDV